MLTIFCYANKAMKSQFTLGLVCGPKTFFSAHKKAAKQEMGDHCQTERIFV